MVGINDFLFQLLRLGGFKYSPVIWLIGPADEKAIPFIGIPLAISWHSWEIFSPAISISEEGSFSIFFFSNKLPLESINATLIFVPPISAPITKSEFSSISIFFTYDIHGTFKILDTCCGTTPE